MDSSTLTLGAVAMALLAYIIGWRHDRLGAVIQQIKLLHRLPAPAHGSRHCRYAPYSGRLDLQLNSGPAKQSK
jgi:hypothetical protein